MKRYMSKFWVGGIGFLLSMAACNDVQDEMNGMLDENVMTFEVLHPDGKSRVTDTGF